MQQRRGVADLRNLGSGPGKLCAALGVSKAHDGLDLDRPPFQIEASPGGIEVVAGPRIGITRAMDMPWRFGEAGSRFLSRGFPRPG
jgi:DNA-3-methyladenine glycosylase